jgi:Phage derived protein Gp49-like (DUF891)
MEPSLGRPRVDTLKGSRIANLKELRFVAGGGVWRVALAFDATRVAVLRVAGDKRSKPKRDLPHAHRDRGAALCSWSRAELNGGTSQGRDAYPGDRSYHCRFWRAG